MSRKAIVVSGAAGSDEMVDGVLHRFSFSSITRAATASQALEQLHQDHADLVIVPLSGMDAAQLGMLERDVRRGRNTFVIGTAPNADPELMLKAMRSGIQEYLVAPADPKDLATAVDRLMRRIPSEAVGGQVVAVFAHKGGLGTTSVATNLAHGFALNHPDGRVALVDMVVTGGDVRVHLNLAPSYDLGDLASKLDRVDNDLLTSLLTPTGQGVWALPSPDDPEADESIDAGTVATILSHLRTHFAFVVVDCEHHMSERTLAALDAADRVVIVTQLRVDALRSTQQTLKLCQRLGYPGEKICVVVNRFQSGEVLSSSDAEDVLKREIYFKLPNDYATSSGSLTRGVPVVEYDANSKLAWGYAKLAAKLGGREVAPRPEPPTGSNGDRSPSKLRSLFATKKRS